MCDELLAVQEVSNVDARYQCSFERSCLEQHVPRGSLACANPRIPYFVMINLCALQTSEHGCVYGSPTLACCFALVFHHWSLAPEHVQILNTTHFAPSLYTPSVPFTFLSEPSHCKHPGRFPLFPTVQFSSQEPQPLHYCASMCMTPGDGPARCSDRSPGLRDRRTHNVDGDSNHRRGCSCRRGRSCRAPSGRSDAGRPLRSGR